MEADSSSLQLIADWGDLEQSELADYHQAWWMAEPGIKAAKVISAR
jgi:hypothetical protein